MSELAQQLISISEELLTKEELEALIQSKKPLRHYIGFEISGLVHIGHASTLPVIKVLQDHGATTRIWLADWHAYINNKLGGDWKNIRSAATYFEHALRASCRCFGIDDTKVEFMLANDYYNNSYWETVMAVAKNTTVARTMRSIDIAGRSAGDSIPTSVMFYPSMQAADIFFLDVNIAHAGMDQRKAHIVARDANLPNYQKPVAVHTHILQGLQKPDVWPVPKDDPHAARIALKMSKSKPGSAIFVHDSPEEITDKIRKAFAPPNETEFNPIIDWVIHLILPQSGSFLIEREEKFGGNCEITTSEQLKKLYASGELFPLDLKNAVAKWLITFLKPARDYFAQPEYAKLLKEMQSLTITR